MFFFESKCIKLFFCFGQNVGFKRQRERVLFTKKPTYYENAKAPSALSNRPVAFGASNNPKQESIPFFIVGRGELLACVLQLWPYKENGSSFWCGQKRASLRLEKPNLAAFFISCYNPKATL